MTTTEPYVLEETEDEDSCLERSGAHNLLEELRELRELLEPLRGLSGAERESVEDAQFRSSRKTLKRLRLIAANHGIFVCR